MTNVLGIRNQEFIKKRAIIKPKKLTPEQEKLVQEHNRDNRDNRDYDER